MVTTFRSSVFSSENVLEYGFYKKIYTFRGTIKILEDDKYH